MQVGSTNKIGQIHTELRRAILEHKWKEGERLPTDSELAVRYECSAGTVNKAMALLVHEKLIERRPGMGTRVLGGLEAAEASTTQLNALAFIYPSDRHEGLSSMLHGFQSAASTAKRRMIMLPTGADFQKEVEFFKRLSEFDVRGAVASPVIAEPSDQLSICQVLQNSKLPIVLCGCSYPGFCAGAVLADNQHAGATATTHLIQQGCKRIGFLSSFSWSQFMRDRYYGYRNAMEEAGIKVESSWVDLNSLRAMSANFVDPLSEPTELATRFLERAPKLDAILCADDFLLSGMIMAASKKGLRIPQDLRLAGIDGFDLTQIGTMSTVDISRMELASYRIPYSTMGEQAFAILDAVVSGDKDAPDERMVRGGMLVR